MTKLKLPSSNLNKGYLALLISAALTFIIGAAGAYGLTAIKLQSISILVFVLAGAVAGYSFVFLLKYFKSYNHNLLLAGSLVLGLVYLAAIYLGIHLAMGGSDVFASMKAFAELEFTGRRGRRTDGGFMIYFIPFGGVVTTAAVYLLARLDSHSKPFNLDKTHKPIAQFVVEKSFWDAEKKDASAIKELIAHKPVPGGKKKNYAKIKVFKDGDKTILTDGWSVYELNAEEVDQIQQRH
jgi:hypothetical protein